MGTTSTPIRKLYSRMSNQTNVFLIVLWAIFSSNASAQTTGTIYGQISDQSGGAIPEANVTVENTVTGLVRKAVSNAEGSYLVPSLPPGPYRLTVERIGFKIFAQTGITVVVAENARVDAALQVGEVTEKVDVSANALAVDTASTTVGTTVDNLRVQAMPLNGRNVLALAQLLPGVGTTNLPTQATLSAQSGIRIPVSGSRSTQNNMMLDGTSMVSQMYNDGTNLPSPDALQEFRILTNTFSAEYGRASGGVFLSVTKSGTNEFHGNLFEYLRNDALNARNFFAGSQKPVLRQNQFGGSIGGPVRLPGYNGKDRTFFFFNYQGTRIRQQSLVTSFPPTSQERQGIFATPITDPATGQPFPNNTIPSNRFDPLAKGILDSYVRLQPNTSSGANNTWLSQPLDGDDYTAKVDHQLSESTRLSFRFYRNDATQGNVEAGNAIGVGLAATGKNLVQTESLKVTTIFSNQLLNEATLSHLRIDSVFEPGPASKSPKELGGNFNTDGPVPQVPSATVSGRFSVSPQFVYASPVPTFQVSDKIAWVHRRHSIAAGAFFESGTRAPKNQFGAAGIFTFTGAFTGNALADYLIGRPVSIFTRSKVDNAARGYKYHFFVQDDFKIGPRLTLNLGLRYEVNTPWMEVKGRSGNIWPGHQSQKIPAAPPGLVYPGDPGVPAGMIPTDKNNFAPRIGLAWDPTGKGQTAIRAAFGVFTNTVGAIMSASPNQAQPFLASVSRVPYSFSDPYDVAHGGIDPFPYTVNYQNPVFVYPMQGYSIDPSFRDGYVEQWNFNIEHQISSVLVRAGYYGLEGHKLSNVRQGNQAVFGPGATPGNVQARRPFFPQYYGDIAVSASDVNSAYHSLQLGVDKKFSHGYTLQLAYTFSKSIDNGSNSSVDAVTCQDGNNCREGERGLSDFNQRYILAINGVWELPFMKRNRIVGGWQLAGLIRIASGTPISALSGSDRALVGVGRGAGAQRLDLVGDWRLDPNRSHGELVANYFNKSAFALPPLGEFGDSGRNIIIGPGFTSTDLSVQKKFLLPGEGGGFEFRADFFNLFNQVNFNNPVNTFTSPAFGKILSAKDARIVQLALRYDF